MKRVLVALFLLLSSNGWASGVSIDSVGALQSLSSVSSITFAHTVAGQNNLLVVTVHNESPAGPITGITYNGVALTQLTSFVHVEYMEMWYLVNPAAGTNNVVVTLSGVSNTGTTAEATSWNNVNQATPFGDFQNGTTATVSSTSLTMNTTSGDMVINVGLTFSQGTVNPTNSETTIYNTTYFVVGVTVGIYSAYIPASGATRVTGWTRDSGSSSMDMIGAVIKQSVTTASQVTCGSPSPTCTAGFSQ